MQPKASGGLTCYVSGVHSGPNPSPGLGVARSLRDAFPHARLIAVDYSPGSSGLHSEVFDDVWLQRNWAEIDLPTYREMIEERLANGALWFAGQDLEVGWLTRSLPGNTHALVPPVSALQQAAKPFMHGARGLPLSVPEFMLLERSDWDLHGFCREWGFRVWVKGPNYEAMQARDWPSFRKARSVLGDTWATEQLFVQRHVSGNEESVAFAAFQGEMLGCVHMRKHQQTHEGKTWAGSVSEVDPAFAEPLRQILADLDWTGGGELEFVRAPDGGLHLIDWNTRFPAWIHAASFAGHNLPARLVEAVGLGTARRSRFRANQFTRVVLELPVGSALPLPPVNPPSADHFMASKHPSGMPMLARRLGETERKAAGQPQQRPAPAIPVALRNDLEAITVDALVTPSRVLLPHTARGRFAQVSAARAEAPHAGVALEVGYSVKTNPHPAILQFAREAGLLAEVISAAELRRALEVGFPAERIIVNGPAQDWPHGPAPEGKLMAAFADSPQTFARWLGDGLPNAQFVGLRLRPVTVESRFGTPFGKPERFMEFVSLLRGLPAEQDFGVHFHMPNEMLGPAGWREVYDGMLGWARAIEQAAGRPICCVDVGGGWFPDDYDREMLPRLPELIAEAKATLPHLVQFMMEPGKAMAQPSMALATTVLEVRRAPDGNAEAVVDAAVPDLPMAPYYPHRVYGRTEAGWQGLSGGHDRLLGRICMETDILASDLHLPEELQPGDRLVIGDAGAYDASMAYNFGRGILDDACGC